MNNFGTLYFYEMKKLLHRKLVFITVILCFSASALSLLAGLIGNYYADGVLVDSNYHMLQEDKAMQKALSGKKIDQPLLEEVMDAYHMIPPTTQRYSSTEEYRLYARPYSAIYNFIGATTNLSSSQQMAWEADEKDLYQKRGEMLEDIWKDMLLSDKERTFWRQKEAEITKPFTFYYQEGYSVLLDALTTIGLLVLLTAAICLSSVFTEEHTRRTDQLILCSTQGKQQLYQAKLLAGISFSLGLSLAVSSFAFLLAFCIYGTDGFESAFQLLYTRYSYPLSSGQALLIAYGMICMAAVITSIFVMIFSELFRSNISALSSVTGLLILGMIVSIPEQYRVLSQIWDWLPFCFLTPWNVFDSRLFPLFGHYLTSWQAVPIIYLLLGAVVAAAGKPLYQRYQVSGR